MLNHPVIRQIREQLDRLKHLENIECVPPMRKDETLGVGITFSVDDLTAARDADAAVIQIETAAGVNYYFDSTIQVRETDGTWSDGEAIWALDLESASSLTLGKRYIAVAVRDEFGNTVSEAQGPYYVSIDVGYGHALDDTAWWIKIVGSLTPASWSGATAYVVGNLVVSGGIDYVCISAHTNHVPPNATYWVPLVLNDAGSYNGSKAYVAGDYVRELRRLWAFSSATGGGGGGGSTTISSDPTSETADGPDYVFTASVENNLPTPGQDYFYVTASTDTIDLKQQRYKDGNYGIDGAFVIGNAVVSGIAEFGCPPDGGIDWSNPHLMGGARLQQFEGNIDSPNAPTFDIPVSEGSGSGKKQCLSQLCASFLFDDPDSETDIPVALYFVTMCREDGVTGGIDVAGYWYGAVVSPGSHQADFLPRFFYQDGFAPSTGYPTFKEGVTGTHEGIEYIGGHRVGGSLDVDALTYTPATSGNWGSSPPSTIVDAIDLISTIVNAYIPTNAPKSYSVPGSYDRIISTDGNYEIKCYGGGGGGGGGSAGTGGDGGGGGEYASETVALRVGDVITIVVGDGGAGGTAGNSGVGGTQSSVASRSGSSFTTVSANGGSGGAPAGAGTGGQGGTGSTNTTHTNGGNGTTGNGTNGGTGGASGLQSGAAGGTGSNTGSAGTSGAGGGGGGPTNGVGGAGGNGVVIIEKV